MSAYKTIREQHLRWLNVLTHWSRSFINFWHKWVVSNIRRVRFWKAQRAFLTRGSGGMLPKREVSLLQAGRTTRYPAIIETPVDLRNKSKLNWNNMYPDRTKNVQIDWCHICFLLYFSIWFKIVFDFAISDSVFWTPCFRVALLNCIKQSFCKRKLFKYNTKIIACRATESINFYFPKL